MARLSHQPVSIRPETPTVAGAEASRLLLFLGAVSRLPPAGSLGPGLVGPLRLGYFERPEATKPWVGPFGFQAVAGVQSPGRLREGSVRVQASHQGPKAVPD